MTSSTTLPLDHIYFGYMGFVVWVSSTFFVWWSDIKADMADDELGVEESSPLVVVASTSLQIVLPLV